MSGDLRAAAEERLRQEESRARESRIAGLVRQEEARREREAEDAARNARVRAAQQEAARLAQERRELEGELEKSVAALNLKMAELVSLDGRHRNALSAAGKKPPGEPLRWMLKSWLASRTGAAVGVNVFDPHDGAPLYDRDPLTAG